MTESSVNSQNRMDIKIKMKKAHISYVISS